MVMFTCNNKEKKVVMQMDILEESSLEPHEVGIYPESILICSDGSVISGHGKEEMSIASWFPSFEMLGFYEGNEHGKIDTDCYVVRETSIKYINTNYLIIGPIY